MSRARLWILVLSIVSIPAAAQANWWDDVGPVRDPEKAKLASRMGIYTQGGWNQAMQGSTGGIPNAFLANAALHPEAQVTAGGVGRQLGDGKAAPTFSWQRLSYGDAESMLVGNRAAPAPATAAPAATQGQSSGRVELTYCKTGGKEKVVSVALSPARQLVLGQNGRPVVDGNRVQFLRQTAGGAVRTVKTRPLAGVSVFAK